MVSVILCLTCYLREKKDNKVNVRSFWSQTRIKPVNPKWMLVALLDTTYLKIGRDLLQDMVVKNGSAIHRGCIMCGILLNRTTL